MKAVIRGYSGTEAIFSVAHNLVDVKKILDNGHRALLVAEEYAELLPAGIRLDCDNAVINSLQGLESYDVLVINRQGHIKSLYLNGSDSNALFVGTKCNCNCVMCPYAETARKGQKMLPLAYLKEWIDYIPSDAPFITVTGGEPTLLGKGLLEAADHLNQRLPYTCIQLLTNGRAFSNEEYSFSFKKLMGPNWRIAIPLHGADPVLHDAITQTPSSFTQTVEGIIKLEGGPAELEVRVVVTRLNCSAMTDIAKYIVDNFHGIACVNFMGLEMMGNAVVNSKDVWIDYEEAFKYVRPAIDYLVENGQDVSIYNFPLCTVDRQYWGMCARSISDYKVTFDSQCDGCRVKEICGGFFNSTGRFGKLSIHRVENDT